MIIYVFEEKVEALRKKIDNLDLYGEIGVFMEIRRNQKSILAYGVNVQLGTRNRI